MNDAIWCLIAAAFLIACIPLAAINDDYMRRIAESMTDMDLVRELDHSDGSGDYQIFADEWKRRQSAKRVKEAA